jgi:hypothetical protein
MKSTTSRKGQTSITHLMSFALPARPHHHPHHHAYSHHARGARRAQWGFRSGHNSVDKARSVCCAAIHPRRLVVGRANRPFFLDMCMQTIASL